MDTAQNKLPSFRKHITLSPVYTLLPSMKMAVDAKRPASGNSAWLNSPIITRATREAGLTLYEILGMAELMRVAYEKGEMESLQYRLSVLTSEAANLSSTLANILDLAKLETGEVEATYEYFDVVALLQEISQTARLIIGQKPVTVMDAASPSPVVIFSDPAKVKRIMTALVSNAAKFTDKGRIALILNKDEDRIRLTVTDTGRGMTTEQVDTVFASSQHDEEIDGHSGSGLGLKITKNLVKLLDGSMCVSSKVGEGTIVDISLPVAPSDKLECSCRQTRQDPVDVRCKKC